jgi:hypothetical protein
MAKASGFSSQSKFSRVMLTMRPLLLIIVIVCFTATLELHAQQNDTLPVLEDAMLKDTIVAPEQKKENWFNRDYPDPKKAATLALILPGAGQLYNKRWWKVPFVYGAIIGMGVTIDYNQSRYRRLRDALDLKRDGEPHEFTGTTLDNERSLRTLRDQFDKNTQMAYVGMFLVYTLQAMEAFVDAHLKTFDVNDDLSLRLKPNMTPGPMGTPVMGIGLSMSFGNAGNPRFLPTR